MRYRRGGVVVICPRLGIVVPELADPSALGPFIEGWAGGDLRSSRPAPSTKRRWSSPSPIRGASSASRRSPV